MNSVSSIMHQDDRGRFLGIHIGSLQGKIASHFTSMDHQKGLILSPGGQADSVWTVRGFANRSGVIYALGDELAVRASFRELMEAKPADLFRQTADLIRVLGRQPAAWKLFTHESLFLDSIFCLADGRFLVLPVSVQDMQYSIMPVGERFFSLDAYRHPGLKGEESFRFSLWCLAGHCLAGRLPFETGSDQVDYSRYLIAGLVQPVETLNPGLVPAAARLLKTGLTNPMSGSLLATNLDSLAQMLETTPAPLPPAGDTGAAQSPQTAGERAYARRKKFLDLSFRLKQNSGRLILAGIVTLVALTIPATILVNKLSPPRTAGLSAREVVQAYFKAYTNHDSELMEDCLAPGVGKQLVNQLSTVEVIRRVRLANEKQEAALDPVIWERDGQLPVRSSNILFGPGAQEIRETKNKDGFAEFETSYTIYSNLESSSDEPGVHLTPVEADVRRDRFFLMFKNDVWVITAIEAMKN